MDSWDSFVEERAGRASGAADEASLWDIVRQDLNFDVLEDNSTVSEAWKRLAISLHDQVGRWESSEKARFRYTFYDFCVIHSLAPEDVVIAGAFHKLLQSMALTGRKLSDLEVGEEKLDAAVSMIQGSTKVFILITPNLDRPDIPKLAYQEALMQKLYRPQWRFKIVPLFPPPPTPPPRISYPPSLSSASSPSCATPANSSLYSSLQISPFQANSISCVQRQIIPFGFANIQGLHIKNDQETSEQVHMSISAEEQGSVRMRRTSEARAFKGKIRRLRLKAYKEITTLLDNLKTTYSNIADPTDILDEMTFQLTTLTQSSSFGVEGVDTNQIIRVINCTNVSMGTSINFNINMNN